MMLVYIAGPLKGKHGFSTEENVIAAVKIYFALVARDVTAICPHAHALFPSAWTSASEEQWMAHDLRLIDRCTHVLLLPRWETSTGACREKEYAERIGKIVTTDLQKVILDAACQPATKIS